MTVEIVVNDIGGDDPSSIWPSGKGEELGWFTGNLETISRRFLAPILVDQGHRAVILSHIILGPISFYEDVAFGNGDKLAIVLDSGVDSEVAKSEFDRLLGIDFIVHWGNVLPSDI